ncbi:hypothetical protein HGA13_19480 [Nocardia speluncae]|uniref:Uncharacterized protein n=1 Tax=Nocardia speluncae TaxID=419477 RepID=A0A846XNF1_9NOCA|nr:hypothetical protein [Nocardia speluncae]NKY35234.1 hypothetical protein [Nocardia speluncae]
MNSRKVFVLVDTAGNRRRAPRFKLFDPENRIGMSMHPETFRRFLDDAEEKWDLWEQSQIQKTESKSHE